MLALCVNVAVLDIIQANITGRHSALNVYRAPTHTRLSPREGGRTTLTRRDL